MAKRVAKKVAKAPEAKAPPAPLDESDPRRVDRISGYELAEVGRRLLAPRRPSLAAVRAALEGIEDPAEAWETLAARELIPTEWTYAGARQVVASGVPCPLCDERAPYIGHAPDCERRDVPATVGAAMTLASDVSGVLAAEEIARGAFARLFDEEIAPSRVVWRVGPVDGKTWPLAEARPGHRRAKSTRSDVFINFTEVRKALRDRDDFVQSKEPMYAAESYYVRNYGPWHAHAMRWFFAFERDAVSNRNWAFAVREKRPNPFTPLCEIWMLGYAVDVIDEEAIVLFAPEVLGPR